MKVFCKRTYFETNHNFFKINGKGYGESWIKWEKGKYYDVTTPNELESKFGIVYYIESEREYTENNSLKKSYSWSPIKKSEFKKYFIDVDEIRQEKINTLLND